MSVNPYEYTHNAMEAGVATVNTNIPEENLDYLKWEIDDLNSKISTLSGQVSSFSAYPVGAVIDLAYENYSGDFFLPCNGAAISRTTYSDLFAVTGTTFGAGNGSTTFNIPDLRAEFIRGWDNGAGVDSGRTFGSSQAADNKQHNHGNLEDSYAYGSVSGLESANSFSGQPQTGYYNNETSSQGGEGRPKNVALMPFIRY